MHKLIKKCQEGSQFAREKLQGYNAYQQKPITQQSSNTTNSAMQQLLNYYNALAQAQQKTIQNTSSGDEQNEDSSDGSNFNFDSFNGTMNQVGKYASLIGDLLPTNNSAQTNAYNKGYDAVSDALMGTPAGWILKVAGLGSDIGYALGDKTDQVTAEDQFLDSKFSRITPGGLWNLYTRKAANKMFAGADINDTMARIGSGYGNLGRQYDEVKDKFGKVIGNAWGQYDKWNNKISDFNYGLILADGIAQRQRDNDLLTAQMQDRWNERTMVDMNGGFGNIYAAKHGVKLDLSKLAKVKEILSRPKVVDTLGEFKDEEVQEFKEGGKMNVIPEGSLHARLHHMENAEGLTKKGIPVVSIAEGGELEQQAEIELNEIIFRLEVTQELEKLMEDGSDNAAIEAGKLLVKEIFENTDDRTGLIKSLEPEKKDPTPEEVVKNHQAFQTGGNIKPPYEEWFKTIPADRNNTENYNLKRAYELAPWEELERWRNATPEQLKDPNYHLHTFYWTDKDQNVGEFVKKNGHPTLINELQEYFTNKDFRENYDLDMSGEYFKYVKKKHD